jgi:hypothetical protein
MKKGTFGLVLSLFASFASGQHAQFVLPRPAVHALWQNDSWGTDSDRFFTNGFELGATVSADVGSLSWLPFRDQPTAATEPHFELPMPVVIIIA